MTRNRDKVNGLRIALAIVIVAIFGIPGIAQIAYAMVNGL